MIIYDNAARCRRWRLKQNYDRRLAAYIEAGGDPAPLRLPAGWTERNYFDGLAIMDGRRKYVLSTAVTGADMASAARLAAIVNNDSRPALIAALICGLVDGDKDCGTLPATFCHLPYYAAAVSAGNDKADYIGELARLLSVCIPAQDFNRLSVLLNAIITDSQVF